MMGIDTERPPRVYVTISERIGKKKKSETLTLYGMDRRAAREFIEDAVKREKKRAAKPA